MQEWTQPESSLFYTLLKENASTLRSIGAFHFRFDDSDDDDLDSDNDAPAYPPPPPGHPAAQVGGNPLARALRSFRRRDLLSLLPTPSTAGGGRGNGDEDDESEDEPKSPYACFGQLRLPELQTLALTPGLSIEAKFYAALLRAAPGLDSLCLSVTSYTYLKRCKRWAALIPKKLDVDIIQIKCYRWRPSDDHGGLHGDHTRGDGGGGGSSNSREAATGPGPIDKSEVERELERHDSRCFKRRVQAIYRGLRHEWKRLNLEQFGFPGGSAVGPSSPVTGSGAKRA